MLVLTRRPGEDVYIGDDIFVRIIGVKGNQVKVGITAPDDLHILRGELLGELPLMCHRDDCNWVDATNEVVRSGEVCLTCHRIRPAQEVS